MPKRTSIKGMGADAFFGPTQQEQGDQQEDISPEVGSQQDSIPVRQHNSTPVSQQLVKATFYLTSEHITALEEVRLKIMKATGKRRDKSELVREAIELLSNQYNS